MAFCHPDRVEKLDAATIQGWDSSKCPGRRVNTSNDIQQGPAMKRGMKKGKETDRTGSGVEELGEPKGQRLWSEGSTQGVEVAGRASPGSFPW